jgi:hypothetical protein
LIAFSDENTKEILFEIVGEINLEILKNIDTSYEIPINITSSDIKTKYFKDKHEIKHKKIHTEHKIGIINGLWANAQGKGGVIPIQSNWRPSEKFLHLITQIRALSPEAGIRSNFIVGFPGETEEDFNLLADFITQAQLDAIGIFGYSDEDKTEALDLSDKVDEEIIAERVQSLSSLADEMVTLRAATRIGEQVRVLIEDEENQEGRAAHQGPEVDGTTSFIGTSFKVGEYVDGVVTQSLGADLIARPL